MPTEPQCTNGSEPLPTAPVWDSFAEADILGAIPTFGAWLTRNLLGLPTSPFSVATFCAVEPIGDLPTVADWAKLFIPPLAAVTGTYTRFANQIKAWKFAELCQCSAPETGVCNAIAVPWTSLTDLGDPSEPRNHAILVTPLGAGRAVYGAEVYNPTGVTISRLILWDATTTTILRQKNTTSPTSGRHTVLFDTPYSLGPTEQVTVAYSWSGSQRYYSWGANAAPPSDGQVTYSNYKENSDYTFCPTSTRSYKAPLRPIVCTGGPEEGEPYAVDPPPAVDIPPDFPEPYGPVTCTTEQHVCTVLNEMSKQIAAIGLQVDLIQRQHVPYEYLTGATHASLTGTNEFAVSGILGLVVSVTTIPASWGYTGDTPRRYIPALGAIQTGDSNGLEDWRQIHYAEEIFLEVSATTTRVVTNVKPGVTMTVTEVTRTV